MGHSLSADKRERQNVQRREHNRTNRGVLKRELKAFEKAVLASPADGRAAFAQVQSALDKAARKNAIPKRRADRKKSRMALLLKRTLAGTGTAQPAAAPKTS